MKNIPISLGIPGLEHELSLLFGAPATVHSLVPYTSEKKCATVTFKDREPHFPSHMEEIASAGSQEFLYDTKFIGITPLFEADGVVDVE